MITKKINLDRKEQIVLAAIDRLYEVGFEGFRLSDVAKHVKITNATLIHHYPTKVELIKAVVHRFTQRFEAVAELANVDDTPSEKLKRHMLSSVELMRASPEMFVVLNEIMIRARRDAEISRLVSIPLAAWKRHIVSLLLLPADDSNTDAQLKYEEIASACMAQLLGLGLLFNSTNHLYSLPEPDRNLIALEAINAITSLLESK